MSTTVRLNLDTADAIRNTDALGNSIEELERKLEAAKDAGDWTGASKISQEIERVHNSTGTPYSGGQANPMLVNAMNQNNARQLDIRLDTITRVISTLTDQLRESTEKGQARESYNLSAALNNAEQERRQLEAEKKRLDNSNNDNSVMEMIKKYGVTRYLSQGMNYVNQIAGIGFNHRIAMANGDYLGADVAALESGAGVAQGIGGAMLGTGMMLGATPIGWALMAGGGLLELGGGIAKFVSGDKKADLAEAEAYRTTINRTNNINKLFDNDGSNWYANAMRTNQIRRDGTTLAADTGLTVDEFLSIAERQARYGVKSASAAMSDARSIALAQSTGTDLGAIQSFLGTARRYGDFAKRIFGCF